MGKVHGLLVVVAALLLIVDGVAKAQDIDLTKTTIVTRGPGASTLERTAATVLAEEVAKRTGLYWPISGAWPTEGARVVVTVAAARVQGKAVPEEVSPKKADGYGIRTEMSSSGPAIWIVGHDARGALFGVGRLLRELAWTQERAWLPKPLTDSTAPEYAIRGHQLGYRATAKSYDAWDARQYDQYVRELALFGANCIEGIPFHDARPTVAPHPRREMNRELSISCERYGLDYWIWTPADFDLKDLAKRQAMLDAHEQLYKDCPRLDAVFFPGGDPGNNPPELVMPFLEDLARLLDRHHPNARIWISLQGFEDPQVDDFYAWVETHMPKWMGGVVAGPSSPSIAETRARLPLPYGLRHYPDITHVVRAQYPAGWIDPALAFTLGREPINPRPLYYRHIHNKFAPYTDGFLTYSDGVHDDVNKAVWSALGWNTHAEPRRIVLEYCRLFFGASVAEPAADGILAQEQVFEGALATKGSVDASLLMWQTLETQAPELAGNWRWQMCLLRAHYDAYVRARLLRETQLEHEANAAMLAAASTGADAAVDRALAILKTPDSAPIRLDLRTRIVDLCEALWQSIGLQTSVEKYGASGAERGAILDFVDYPLNNRWWLEDELQKVKSLATEQAKVERLAVLGGWEDPGPGGFYDDIGNVAKSDRVIRGEQVNSLVEVENAPVPDFMWWDDGQRRVRQSWVSKMDWPLGLRYIGLDPNADYVLRTTGNRDCLPRANGIRLVPTIDGKEVGAIKEFPIPRRAYRDRVMEITFDVPFEPHIGWRDASRLSEVWLIKR